MRKATSALVTAGALVATVLAAAPATADTRRDGDLLVLTESGTLSQYDARLPLVPRRTVRVTGLGGDKLVGLDVRPATGAVYAIGSRGQLYTVDRRTGAATKVGVPVTLTGRAVGIDFNPTVDRIRVVTDTGQNLRLNPDTGAVAATDTPLAYAPGDRGAGRTPAVAAAGYTNSGAGATTTALYGIDSRADTVVLQGSVPGATPVVSPNTGQLFTVGRLGLDVGELNGFDIRGVAAGAGHDPADYRAVAAVRTSGVGLSLLVNIDLRSGRASVASVLLDRPVGLAFVS